MLCAKHLDPIVGVDVHIIMIPSPAGPIPTPLPNPKVGMLFDPMDYVPIVGAAVMVNGLPRATAGTGSIATPPHIPMGGPFMKPPSNEAEMFMGSMTVSAEGSPLSYMGLPVLSCQDVGMPAPPRPKKKTVAKSLMLPTTVVIAIPAGPIVMVGGPPIIMLPTVDSLLMGAAMAVAGKLLKKAKKAFKGKGKGKAKKPKKKKQNSKCTRPGEPVDPVTGANADEIVDFAAPDAGRLVWERSYDSSRPDPGPLGWGFRHSFQWSLRLDRARAVLVTDEGQEVVFPREPGSPSYGGVVDGWVLTQSSELAFSVRRGQVMLDLARRDARVRTAVLVRRTVEGAGEQRCFYDPDGRLVAIAERSAAGETAQTTILWDAGRISELRRQVTGRPEVTIAAYRYDRQGHLVEVTDALGGRLSYAWDASHRMTAKTDRNGYTFAFTYDQTGRCVAESGQDGLWRVQLRYEAGMTIVTEADGGIWKYLYDETGTITAVIDPYGGAERRVLDEEGRVRQEIDAGGTKVHWLYDELGHHYGRLLEPHGQLVAPADDDPNPDPELPGEPPATHFGQQVGGETLTMLEEQDVAWMAPAEALAELAAVLPAGSASAALVSSYDHAGRLVEARDGLGRVERWAYDRSGNVIAHQDRDGRQRQFVIGSWNLVQGEIDPLGNRTDYEYTAREQVAAVVDPNGGRSEYVWDLKDRLVEVRRHGEVRERYVHDLGDNIVEQLDARGKPLVRYKLGPGGLATKQALASGEEHVFAYDTRGLPTEASSKQAAVEMVWDALGQRELDACDGLGISHLFVGRELRSSLYFGRFEVQYRREAANLLTVETPDGRSHWLRRGRRGVLLLDRASGTSELARFDDDGCCAGRVTYRRAGSGETDVWSLRAHYTPGGLLHLLEDRARGAHRYAYDGAGRLVAEAGPDGAARRWAYDRAGNLVATPRHPLLRYGEGNRIAAAGLVTLELDGRQRLSARTEPDGRRTSYEYDSLDRLVKVSWSDRPEAWSATYDGLGRRLTKKLGDREWRFFWDGDRLGGEIDPDGHVRIYVYLSEQALVPFLFIDYDDLSADPASGRCHHVFGNHQGVPVRIEDDRGQVVWSAVRVDPYGEIEVLPDAALTYNLRWPGHYADPETGLHDNRFRSYSPELGRYLQPDPLGQAGGVNLYAYTPNPLVEIDVQGLHPKKAGASKAKGKGKGKPKKETPRKKPQKQMKPDKVEPTGPNDRFQNGKPMPPGSTKSTYGKGDNVYYHDSQGRLIRAEGTIKPKKNYTKRGAPSKKPPGFKSGRDDRGHCVSERGAKNQKATNVNDNIIAEHSKKSNKSKKKEWENETNAHAAKHPENDYRSVHEPQYDGNSVRPKSVDHYFLENGEEMPQFTKNIPNPTR